MAYTNTYTRINWQNLPSEATALNDVNLNKMDAEIYNHGEEFEVVDTAITNINSSLNGKVDKEAGKGLSAVKSITISPSVNTGTKIAEISYKNQDNLTIGYEIKNGVVVDSALSSSSENPVQNKVVKSAIDAKSTVSISDTLVTGDTIANLTIDGTTTAIKAPLVEVDDTPSATSENPLQNKAIYEMLNNLLPEETAQGNPIAISDASGLNAKACSVDLLPIQDLSHGEPSPTNICPISGRTQASVTRTGKNLAKTLGLTFANPSSTTYSNATPRTFTANSYFWGLTYNNYFNTAQISNNTYSNGVFEFKSGAGAYGANIPIIGLLVGETYTISAESTNGVINVSFYDKNGNYMSNVNTASFTVPENTYYSVICLRVNANNATATFKNIQIELGSSATEYEPYQGETYTETLGQTVYGGKVDFVSGKLTVEWAYIASYAGETIAEPWVSDRDVYVPNTTPTNGAEVAYKLATPIEITLTAEQISLLKGNNVISSDGDSIKLVYSADIALYIAGQLQNS